MGGMFSSPKKPDLPPPQAIPEVDLEGVKKGVSRRGGGRAATMITGELEPETTKKTLLG